MSDTNLEKQLVQWGEDLEFCEYMYISLNTKDNRLQKAIGYCTKYQNDETIWGKFIAIVELINNSYECFKEAKQAGKQPSKEEYEQAFNQDTNLQQAYDQLASFNQYVESRHPIKKS